MQMEQRQPDQERQMTAAERAAAERQGEAQISSKPLVGAGLAVAVLVGAGIVLWSIFGGGAVASGGDTLTGAQEKARVAGFQQAMANVGKGVALDAVPAGELRAALAVNNLPAKIIAAFERDVQAGAVKAAFLTVRDNNYEDGDTVQIDAGGMTMTVVLQNAPTRLPIPVPPGGLVVSITGVHDGGGGITLEVQGLSTVLREGQSITVPVAAP